MRKTIALIAGILSVTSALAVRPDLGAAVTGGTATGSWVNVRVTANVVEGIAVNEASPIDFGNLVKDNNASDSNRIYQPGEQIHHNTPGRVTYRANINSSYKSFTTKLNTDRIDLDFYGSSGVEDNQSTNKVLKNIKIEGIGTQGEKINLIDGKAEKLLTAWFQAYDGREAENAKTEFVADYENGNLGKQQKLGYYEGTVRVYAEAQTGNSAM